MPCFFPPFQFLLEIKVWKSRRILLDNNGLGTITCFENWNIDPVDHTNALFPCRMIIYNDKGFWAIQRLVRSSFEASRGSDRLEPRIATPIAARVFLSAVRVEYHAKANKIPGSGYRFFVKCLAGRLHRSKSNVQSCKVYLRRGVLPWRLHCVAKHFSDWWGSAVHR